MARQLRDAAQITVDTTPTLLIGSNDAREALILQNIGTDQCWIGTDQVTTTTGQRLASGDTRILSGDACPHNAIYAVRGAALSATVVVQEVSR